MKLKMEYEKSTNLKYDFIFKLRFDAPFPNELNFKELSEELKKNDKSVICNKHKISYVTRIA